jgi:hypothetical protein
MLIEAPYLMEDDWVFASPASKGQLALLVFVHLARAYQAGFNLSKRC